MQFFIIWIAISTVSKLGVFGFFPSIERTFTTWWEYLFTAEYLSPSSLSWPAFHYFRFVLCFQHVQLRAGFPFWIQHCTHRFCNTLQTPGFYDCFFWFCFCFSLPKLLQESCFHATITQVTLIWTGIQGFIAWILLRDSFVSWVTVTSLQYFCFVSLNHVIYKYRNPLLCSFLWHKMLFETELCVLPLEILTFSHTCL